MSKHKHYADRELTAAYSSYNTLLHHYCSVRLKENKSAVDDCVQNTFLVYYRRLLHGEVFRNPKAFLYCTAENMCKKADEEILNTAKRTVTIEQLNNIAAPEDNGETMLLDYDFIRDILVERLNEKEKDLYLKKYVQRMSLEEIGRILGITPSAVANRTSRLRKKIYDLITPVLEEYKNGGQK